MNMADPLLHALLQDPTDGVLLADSDGSILEVNDVLRDVLSPAVDLGPRGRMGGIFAHTERGETELALWDALTTHMPRTLFSRLELAVMNPYHAVHVTALPLEQDDGQVWLLLRLTDITVQRRLEAQLERGQKLQAMGQLAGGIAHDFGNLLTAILGAIDMAERRGGLDGEIVEDIRQVRRAGERGVALVRQLLSFGREQASQLRVLAVDAAIRDIAAILRPLLGTKIRLVLGLESPGQLAKVDPSQLDQVLVNLAVNARDAMQEGGTLTLQSTHATLYRPLTRSEETIPAGRYVMIEMRDTGVGIAPDVLPRIFEPFFTTKGQHGGTGLGLATVQSVVRKAGGFLTIDSVEGYGTSVRVYLPRYDGPAELAVVGGTEILPAMEAASPGGIILVVDDEAMVSGLIARALRKQGWLVEVQDSGESALAWQAENAESRLIGIISDMSMPGMDGLALVNSLRKALPGLPAILISGYAAERLRNTLSYEKIAFLPKPYSTQDLLDLVVETFASRDLPMGQG